MHKKSYPFSTNLFGDKYLYAINREDFNQSGANAIFREKLSKDFFRTHCLHVIIGTDSGLLPAFIANHGVPKGSIYLFIEMDEYVEEIKNAHPTSNKSILIGTTNTAFSMLDSETALGEQFYLYLGNVLLHESVAARNAHLDAYKHIHGMINDEINRRIFLHRALRNSRQHSINMLLNAPESLASANLIKDIFYGKTAIITAPGPSLSEHFDWIRSNRESIILISLSRLAPTLRHENLEPDIIVSIDPKEINFRNSLPMYAFKRSLLAYTSFCNHPMVAIWPGIKIYLGPMLPWTSEGEYNTLNNHNITATNTAIDLADWLGAVQIVLLGVDLCLDQNGDKYTLAQNPDGGGIETRLYKVETNNDDIRFTPQDYYEAATGISRQAKILLNKGKKIINASKKAMKIPYVEYRCTRDIQTEDLPEPAYDTLNSLCSNTDINAHWTQLERELKKKIAQLQQLSKKISSGIKHIEQAMKKGGSNQTNPYTVLRKTNELISNSKEAELVKLFNWKPYAELSLILSDERNEIFYAQKKLFDYYIEHIPKTIGLIKLSLDQIKLLRKEKASHPSEGVNVLEWGKLVSQYPSESSFSYDAICYRWRNRYPEKYQAVSHEWKSAIDNCCALLENKFIPSRDEIPESGSFTKSPLSQNDVIKFLSLLQRFSHDDDNDGLVFLKNQLSRHTHHEMESIIHYIDGIQAERENDVISAFTHYQTILNTPNSLIIKDALLKIYLLCINQSDIDNAMIALEALCDQDPVYLKDYAKLLSIIGKKQEAIDIYKGYMNHFPSDNSILSRLFGLYVETDQIHELQEICQILIELNPNDEYLQKLCSEHQGRYSH